jgi:hypothetical protein
MANASASSDRPYWLPDGIDFDSLGEQTQRDIIAVVNPAYRQRVANAPNALARAQGLLFVQSLFWALQSAWAMGLCWRGNAEEAYAKLFGQHMRFMGAHQKIATFLLNLDKYHDRRDPTKSPGDKQTNTPDKSGRKEETPSKEDKAKGHRNDCNDMNYKNDMQSKDDRYDMDPEDGVLLSPPPKSRPRVNGPAQQRDQTREAGWTLRGGMLVQEEDLLEPTEQPRRAVEEEEDNDMLNDVLPPSSPKP